MMNFKKLAIAIVAMTMVLLPVSVGRAAAASIEIPTATFMISQLGDFTLVAKEGVPQTIIVRGRDLTGKGVGFSVKGTPYMGDVLLSNNLTLLPGTTPLMFEHKGVVEFTAGASMLVLKYDGTATKTKDLATLTRTLNSGGDFVVADAVGAFAGLKGVKGTYKLTLMCHITPGVHPKVGSPVEVMFSAMGE